MDRDVTRSNEMSNTYWGHNGLYEETANKLINLIPAAGPVDRPHKNRELERLRKAVNAYYDLYNNGLYNRASSFAKIFGIAPNSYRQDEGDFNDHLYRHTEEVMNGIIELAAREQGIELIANTNHQQPSKAKIAG